MSKMHKLILRAHVWSVAFMLPLLVRFFSLRKLLWVVTPPKFLRLYSNAKVEDIVAEVSRRLAEPVNMRRRACLRRGLTLFHFLRLAGHPAELHFAVYPMSEQDTMHAHCWVTVAGTAVSYPPQGPHKVIMTYGNRN